jgi:ferric-dicitrate binding protein FerR (iron transport regulator)
VGKERRVTITGEAYFEIKENAALPFVVATNNKGEIQVLGTQFNVNAYEDEPVVKTTLLEGAVQVKKDGATLLLKPGEQAQLTMAGDLTRTKDVDMEETLAWKNGKFSCKNKALEDIMRQVARWYDVEIVYEDRITDRYTASVARDVPVSSLLRYLELSEGVHFRIEGKKITVVK